MPLNYDGSAYGTRTSGGNKAVHLEMGQLILYNSNAAQLYSWQRQRRFRRLGKLNNNPVLNFLPHYYLLFIVAELRIVPQ